jgi:hypothetical protein
VHGGEQRHWWRRGLVVLLVAAAVVVGVLLIGGGDDDDPSVAERTGEEAEDGASDDGEATDDASVATDDSVAPDGAVEADAGAGGEGPESPNDPNAPPVDPNEGPNAPPVLDPSAPVGTRENPTAIGAAAEMGGWRITVASAGGGDGSVTARVRLVWSGREDVQRGDPGELVLRISDAGGTDQVLGGAACPEGAAGALSGLDDLSAGGSVEVDLCWTVPAGSRSAMALVAESAQLAETVFLAVG